MELSRTNLDCKNLIIITFNQKKLEDVCAKTMNMWQAYPQNAQKIRTHIHVKNPANLAKKLWINFNAIAEA
jgi:hypothetical protein